MMPQSKMEPKDYGFTNWWELLESRAIRHDIMTRPDLSRIARDLFAFLWRAKKTLKFIIFGVKYIAREIHCHPRSVQRAIQQLITAGLLRLERRKSPTKHDPTSNRYYPIWTPYTDRQKEYSETSSNQPDLSLTSVQHRDAPLRQEQTSSMPGEDMTQCRDPLNSETPETVEAQEIPPLPPQPILDPLLRKKDQPGRLLLSAKQALESGTASSGFDDVIANIPTDWHIYTPRIAQWLSQFGLKRVQTVIQWVIDAPKGSIRQPGGWIYRALTEDWAQPTWEKDSIVAEKAIQIRKQQVDDEMTKRQQEEQERQDALKAFNQTWAMVEPLIDQPEGQTLLQRAYELATTELKSMTNTLFKTGSPLWKSFIIRAWQGDSLTSS